MVESMLKDKKIQGGSTTKKFPHENGGTFFNP